MRISDWSSDVCSSDLVSGLLMMFSNLLFAVLASVGHSPLMLALAVGTENFTSGIGLTVFVTYLSGLSSLAYTATQFALLSSFAAVGRTWLAAPGGYVDRKSKRLNSSH